LRTLLWVCLLVTFSVGVANGQAAAPQNSNSQNAQGELVLQGDTTPRPALPTYFGDTGLWFIPTAETLPKGKASFSVYRANFDRPQGLTDVGEFGITGAIGLGRAELFGSWRIGRFSRNISPIFIPTNSEFGGVNNEFPYQRDHWSRNLGEPIVVGAKWGLLSQSRGNGMALAPRFMLKFPSGGATAASTKDYSGTIDLVASGEAGGRFELSGLVGYVFRGDSDDFSVTDSFRWGLGAGFPGRASLRVLLELEGDIPGDDAVLITNPPLIALDGSIAPLSSDTSNNTAFKAGLVWQSKGGFFLHGGGNYSFGTGKQTIGGVEFEQSAWGFDARIGWHPGVTPPRHWVRVPPPPPPAPPPTPPPPPAPKPPPPANRNPTFNVAATCTPTTVQPGQTVKLNCQATDPDGDAVTYRWTAPQGTFNPADAANSTWTAPNQPGTVVLTVTASDGRGGTATSSCTVNVAQREVIAFEDVHFAFDRFNLAPEALKILDDAVAKLQANPDINVTIEGHTDSIGTSEYNLALGERRSNSVRDYLSMRGVPASRLRTVSYGEERPIATNDTSAGRAMNRRAHLLVVLQ